MTTIPQKAVSLPKLRLEHEILSLLQSIHDYLDSIHDTSVPKSYSHFCLFRPEHSSREAGKRSFPVSEHSQLFALLWDIHDQNLLSATLLPTPRPFIAHNSFRPPSRTQLHSHDYIEMFYIVKGEYRQRILDREITFHQGEVCLIDKNCQHQELLNGTSATILFLGISNMMFDLTMKQHLPTERIASFINTALLEQKATQQYLHFTPRTQESISKMESVLSYLLHELRFYDTASTFICQGLFLRIFFILSQEYDFSLSKRQRKKMNELLTEEVTDYMNQHLSQISIQDLSRTFHFNEDYFNRLLKSQMGMTYTEYLQLLRLRKAEHLLLHTTKTVEEISHCVGYHNKGYFYKIFVERHQVTPAQFRLTQRSKGEA